jgi:pSer/pThr/pTyr-binding forkhead associated (FHA) protein
MALKLRDSTFIITREDRAEDAKTLVTEGLRIGRSPECDIALNHPTVSRLHAGINEVGGRFYIVNISGSNATTLNSRTIPFDAADALANGDLVQIGPFFLQIEQASERTLKVRVTLQFALNVGEMEARLQQQVADQKQQAEVAREAASTEIAGALKVFWDKRTREKAGRQSPLHPHSPPRLGKARFNWTPTRDLVRPWPASVFVWGIIIVAALSALAAFKFKNAFAPQPISTPHTRAAFLLDPPIAKEPNGNSCTTCHSVGVSAENRAQMETNCASCHQVPASFLATTTRAHRDAGITCTVCHTEHQGADFKPMDAALNACATCHNDNNKKLYNGKSVHTPHGGTVGYPVVGGEWVWKGLDDEELALKPEIAKLRRPGATEQQWRNAQFHNLHYYRVRTVAGIQGIEDEDAGNGMRVISCSSCHALGSRYPNIDRTTPRTKCILCHNALIFEPRERTVRATSVISCTSCHIQHIRDQHWRPSLFADAPLPKDFIESITAK